MPRAKTPAKKEPRSRPLSLSDLDHNAVPRPGRKVQTQVQVSASDARKALSMQGIRSLEEQIDITKPYFVISLVEVTKEMFTSPRGSSSIEKVERKQVNAVHLRLRKQQLDANNKWGMVEDVETMNLPCRTDVWAADNDYPLDDVNRALYASKGCYPHRGAFYRMYDAANTKIEVGNEEFHKTVQTIRANAADRLKDAATAQARAGGSYMGIPGSENANPTLQSLQHGGSLSNISNAEEVAQMIASGELSVESIPA